MICRLCLKDENEILQIFDNTGMQLNIATVLGKYFWFEPKEDDPISKVLCKTCWKKITEFHEFYAEVEEAHRLLTERFSVKHHKHDKKLAYNASNLRNKTKDSSTDSSNKSLDINPILNDSGSSTVLEDKLMYSTVLFATDRTCEEEEFYANDEESFNGERFMAKILSDGNSVSADNEQSVKSEPTESTPIKRRLTRANKNLDAAVNIERHSTPNSSVNKEKTSEVEKIDEPITKKRRGRPPKIKGNLTKNKEDSQNNQDEENNKGTGKTTETRQKSSTGSSTKKKADEADLSIAQHVRLLCEICTVNMPTFAELRSHMMKQHRCKGYAVCCNKKFYKRALLSDHVAQHINPECYKCQDCDKVFADKQCMRNHFLLKHQPEENKVFQCDHCSKKFAKPYLLEQHRVLHEDRKHICGVCKRGFPTTSLLGSHIKLTHESYGTMCDICAKVIRGRANFKRHQLEHLGITQPKVQCSTCGSWHKNKYSLQKHKRRHNEDGTVHICDICNKKAPNRSALLSHKRYVHASTRSYNCSVCDKSFKKPINLREHMATHTGEVLYKCPHCTKTFNSNANMHSHRKKMHPQEFEESRKNRITAKSKSIPIKPIQAVAREAVDKSNTNQENIANAKSSTSKNNDENLPKILTIQTGENGETHQVIVTSEEYDDPNDNNEKSIVFTIN